MKTLALFGILMLLMSPLVLGYADKLIQQGPSDIASQASLADDIIPVEEEKEKEEEIQHSRGGGGSHKKIRRDMQCYTKLHEEVAPFIVTGDILGILDVFENTNNRWCIQGYWGTLGPIMDHILTR